ncbi:MAG: bifunctional 2',3'-cyclic-nucleotide 2'-phosphodiesterase/3'-nucleotidase [Pseudomonadota bacterium]
MPATQVSDVALRIMATTDLHAHLVPYDYFNDRPVDGYGLTRTAALILQARAEVTQSLLFDNGDFLQGSAIGDYLARGRTRLPHSMITAFGQLGYDAGTLGNHEFNYGLPFLARVLAEARHPVVSANLMLKRGKDPSLDHHLVPPFAILTRQVVDGTGATQMLKIGVIGFTPPQILQWDRQHLEGRLQVCGMIDAAQVWVPRLRRAGADLVVVLAHTGIAAPSGPTGRHENCAVELAAIDGVDVMIAGHSHLAFPGPDHLTGPGIDPKAGRLSGKPAILPGHFGSHLGIIDLALRRSPWGGWSVAASRSHLRAVTDLHPRKSAGPAGETVRQLESAAIDVHRATRRWIRREIGRTDHRLQSYFSLVADSMTLGLVAAAQADHVARALLGTDLAPLPLLSAVAPIKAGGWGGPTNYVDIPAGPLAFRHAADLCPFPNTVAALRLTGVELADWLERSASIYHQILPGAQDSPLINAAFASFHQDRVYGVGYEIDLSFAPRFAPDGTVVDRGNRRIRNLTHRGLPVRPEDSFVLATNSFRSGGAGHYVNGDRAHVVLETRLLSRDMLARFILQTGTVAPPEPQLWRFSAIGLDTSVTFDTSPRALGCQHDPLTPGAEPLEMTPAGFQRFRMRL